jgi:hypothetical protein
VEGSRIPKLITNDGNNKTRWDDVKKQNKTNFRDGAKMKKASNNSFSTKKIYRLRKNGEINNPSNESIIHSFIFILYYPTVSFSALAQQQRNVT